MWQGLGAIQILIHWLVGTLRGITTSGNCPAVSTIAEHTYILRPSKPFLDTYMKKNIQQCSALLIRANKQKPGTRQMLINKRKNWLRYV